MSHLFQSSSLNQPQFSICQYTAQDGMFGFRRFPLQRPASRIPAHQFNISHSSNVNINFGGSQVNEQTSEGGSGGDGGNSPPGSGGEDHGNFDGKEFWNIQKFAAASKRNVEAASDAARNEGFKEEISGPAIFVGSKICGLIWRGSFLLTSCLMLSNPELADTCPLFKAVAGMVTCCSSSTFSGLQKKGKEFWSILLGAAVSIAVDKILATYAGMGPLSSASSGFSGHLKSAFVSPPSSIFGGGSPGFNYSLKQQVGTYFCKGTLVGRVGLGCGLIYHIITNLVMTGDWTKKSDTPASYIAKNVALWGVLLPLSSDSRSQIVKGLNQLVQESSLGKQIPLAALAFAGGMRFAVCALG